MVRFRLWMIVCLGCAYSIAVNASTNLDGDHREPDLVSLSSHSSSDKKYQKNGDDFEELVVKRPMLYEGMSKEDINLFLEKILYSDTPEIPVTTSKVSQEESGQSLDTRDPITFTEEMPVKVHFDAELNEEKNKIPSFKTQRFINFDSTAIQEERKNDLKHTDSIVISEECSKNEIETEDMATQTPYIPRASIDALRAHHPMYSFLNGCARWGAFFGTFLLTTPFVLEGFDVDYDVGMWRIAAASCSFVSWGALRLTNHYEQKKMKDIERIFSGKTVTLKSSRSSS